MCMISKNDGYVHEDPSFSLLCIYTDETYIPRIIGQWYIKGFISARAFAHQSFDNFGAKSFLLFE